MLNLELAIIILVYVLSYFSGNFAACIVRSYHLKKPLGMQTFLGQVIVLLVNVFIVQSFVLVGPILLIEIAPSPKSHFIGAFFQVLGT